MAGVRLYVLVTESVCRRPWLEAAEQAILGGRRLPPAAREAPGVGRIAPPGPAIRRTLPPAQASCRSSTTVPTSRCWPAPTASTSARAICRPAAVRKWIGAGMILGVSTHNLEQARQAVRDGADYIGVGPFFRSAHQAAGLHRRPGIRAAGGGGPRPGRRHCGHHRGECRSGAGDGDEGRRGYLGGLRQPPTCGRRRRRLKEAVDRGLRHRGGRRGRLISSAFCIPSSDAAVFAISRDMDVRDGSTDNAQSLR